METMFFGAVALTQAVLRAHAQRRSSGAIVQMSSQGGQLAFAGVGAYCAAKFALEGLTEALAAEVGPLGIRDDDRRAGLLPHRVRRHAACTTRPSSTPTPPPSARRARFLAERGRHAARRPGARQRRRSSPRSTPREPPLRLALGDDAVDAIRAEHERLRVDIDAWETVSRDTAVDSRRASC